MKAAAIAIAVLLSGLGIVALSSGSDADDPEVGFNDNSVARGLLTPTRSAELLASAGAQVDRVQIDWDRLEPQRGKYDFSTYDAIYRADLAAGVRPLFVFAYAPPWAAGDACESVAGTCHAAPDPASYDDAARTAAVIADRYPRARGIEIWNEPNTSYFWAPRPDPTSYAALLAACYSAIKRADPDMTVAGGSTANTTASGSISPADFIGAVSAAGGEDSMDALSVHAYPDPGDASASSAADAVNEVAAARDGDEPIWVTETGATTTGAEAVTPDVQALMLQRLNSMLSGTDGVEMVLIHTLVAPPGPAGDPEAGFGVLAPDGTPLPSYCALSDAWGGTADC